MLKKSITFEDLDGNEITEDFYFHLRKSDLIELEVEVEGGLTERIKAIVEADDNAAIIAIFKKIILAAYGVRAPDGRGFIQNDKLRQEFAQTDAYSVLFMELATDAKAAAEFINGVIPSSLAKQVEDVTSKTGSEDLSSLSKEELLKRLEGNKQGE